MEKKTWKDRLIQRLLELNRNYTIKQKILASFLAVIIGMTALNLFVVYRLYTFNSRYDEIIQRTTNANRMVDLNNEIIFEAWPLSIGNLSLEEIKMTSYFDEMERHLAEL